MNDNPLKVLEIFASDGRLEVLRQFLVLDKENRPEYLYVLKESGNIKDIEAASFDKFWNKVLAKYQGIYGWDLQFVHDDLKLTIVKNIRARTKKQKFWIDDSWREKLCDNKQIIDTIDYFDFEYFVEQIEKFKHRIEIEGWNYITVNHSSFKNKNDYRKFLLDNQIFPLNVSGLYSYFENGICIYIGKAKNIQNRIETHYLSSYNLGNLSRGAKHRKLFGKYLNQDLTIFYTKLDDPFSSQIGEELRNTIERLLHLKYNPEFLGIEKTEE